jgi:hypothetical protein
VSPPGSPPLQPRLKRQDETSFHGKPLGNSGGHESSRTARRRKVPVFPDGCGTAVYRCVSECARYHLRDASGHHAPSAIHGGDPAARSSRVPVPRVDDHEPGRPAWRRAYIPATTAE